jgi:hypothetical protein
MPPSRGFGAGQYRSTSLCPVRAKSSFECRNSIERANITMTGVFNLPRARRNADRSGDRSEASRRISNHVLTPTGRLMYATCLTHQKNVKTREPVPDTVDRGSRS